MNKDNLGHPRNFGSEHLDTLIPYFLRRVPSVAYRRERVSTPDGDFLDLDWVQNKQKKLLILSHGLESSSDAKYIRAMLSHFCSHDFDALAWNYRGCSGEMNRGDKFYHAASSYDLRTVISHVFSHYAYQEIYLIGFSLGGNITLKYLIDEKNTIDPRIKKAMAISAPIDMYTSSLKLDRGFGRLYSLNFLRTLVPKVYARCELFEQKGIDISMATKVRTLSEFDNYFTAPLHGFGDKYGYYKAASTRPYLDKICIPTIILNAVNDPFLGEDCMSAAVDAPMVEFITPAYGGHVGFQWHGLRDIFWSEEVALRFFMAL